MWAFLVHAGIVSGRKREGQAMQEDWNNEDILLSFLPKESLAREEETK